MGNFGTTYDQKMDFKRDSLKEKSVYDKGQKFKVILIS